jgi:hypothetical protein
MCSLSLCLFIDLNKEYQLGISLKNKKIIPIYEWGWFYSGSIPYPIREKYLLKSLSNYSLPFSFTKFVPTVVNYYMTNHRWKEMSMKNFHRLRRKYRFHCLFK